MSLKSINIASLIPHSGKMCLLDHVIDFDEKKIRVIATSHRDADNPLKVDHRLNAVCGVEYAAQSMALHSELISTESPTSPQRGYLASIRKLQLYCHRLDTVFNDVLIESEKVGDDERMLLYKFKLLDQAKVLCEGRLSIYLIEHSQ